MPDKLHKTKGIVLKTVKYGETSIIVTIFTELFGVQSYLVNGVRTSTKKGTGKANLFQPSAILDLVVYHNDLKHLNRIKEFKWATIYQHILSDVSKNAVALFMVELLTKCLKQPEGNPLHLAHFFGFRVTDDYSTESAFLDLMEGSFVQEQPHHPHFLEDKQAFVTSQLLKAQQPGELEEIKLNHDFRRQLLHVYETYYALHIPDFGTMKSLPVLRVVLG